MSDLFEGRETEFVPIFGAEDCLGGRDGSDDGEDSFVSFEAG